jgi:GNAT superfamily N-acetyltransferase
VGREAAPFIDHVARLRIEVFHEYPYLYVGDMDYERRYLSTYVQDPESLVVIAFDEDGCVRGASTGVPMAHEQADFRRPFEAQGFDTDAIFYFGESVIERDWRGRGTGVEFFREREAYAARLGRFRWTCFCGVVRPDGHPLRPAGYEPLDEFWARRGYRRIPGLATTFSWKEIGEAAESPKPMQFWMKEI